MKKRQAKVYKIGQMETMKGICDLGIRQEDKIKAKKKY